MTLIFFHYIERTSCLIIIGGYNHESGFSPLHVISEGLEIKRYVNLPLHTNITSMVLHNGNILLCGGENS